MDAAWCQGLEDTHAAMDVSTWFSTGRQQEVIGAEIETSSVTDAG